MCVQASGKGWERTTETKEFCGSRRNIGSHPGSGEHHFANIHSEWKPYGVSVIPVKSIVQKVWKNICQKNPTVSRRRMFCESMREERSHLDKAVEVRMLCCASNSEVVQNLLMQTWNLHATKHETCTRTFVKVKKTCVQACDNSSCLPTGQLKKSCPISVRLRT